MPILPSIRPVSPLSNAVTAQANSSVAHGGDGSNIANIDRKSASKKIGRQLSVNSHGNHYAELHRQEAERALNGTGLISPSGTQKESFFSHLRKRARRLSGRNQVAAANDDIEANAGCVPWSNRSSMALDSVNAEGKSNADFSELDKALQNVKYNLETTEIPVQVPAPNSQAKRQSMPQGSVRSLPESPVSLSGTSAPVSSRTRRAMQMTSHPVHRYETPEEEDELLHEVLYSTHKAAKRLAQGHALNEESSNESLTQKNDSRSVSNPYPTPSPSARRDGVTFGQSETPSRRSKATGMKGDENSNRQWPTPPYEESEWHSTASTDLFAAGATYR